MYIALDIPSEELFIFYTPIPIRFLVIKLRDLWKLEIWIVELWWITVMKFVVDPPLSQSPGQLADLDISRLTKSSIFTKKKICAYCTVLISVHTRYTERSIELNLKI